MILFFHDILSAKKRGLAFVLGLLMLLRPGRALSFTGSASTYSSPSAYLVILFAAPVAVRSYNIVLVGDSYASGNGARDSTWTLGSTELSSYNYEGISGCFRSPTSWGSQLQEALGASSFLNRACSSGSVAHISTSPRKMGDSVAKIDGECPTSPYAPEEYYVSSGANSCDRYLQPQINGIDRTTDVVILAVGGNDLQFEILVKHCFVPSERSESKCQAAMTFARGALAQYTQDLGQAIIDIQTVVKPAAQIWLVAYPHVIQPDSPPYRCCWWSGDGLDVTTPMRALGLALDDAQRSAISIANNNAVGKDVAAAFFYDETKAVFNGHEPDPDSTDYNPNRWVFELLNAELAEWWHLNPTGHQQLGTSLANYLESRLPAPTCRFTAGGDPSYISWDTITCPAGGACIDSSIEGCRKVVCTGLDSCLQATTKDVVSIDCLGETSCESLVATGSESVHCQGGASCYNAKIGTLDAFTTSVNCHGVSACTTATIYSESIICEDGADFEEACKETIITGDCLSCVGDFGCDEDSCSFNEQAGACLSAIPCTTLAPSLAPSLMPTNGPTAALSEVPSIAASPNLSTTSPPSESPQSPAPIPLTGLPSSPPSGNTAPTSSAPASTASRVIPLLLPMMVLCHKLAFL